MREDIVEKFSQMYGSKFCISMYYRDTNHKGFKKHFIDFFIKFSENYAASRQFWCGLLLKATKMTPNTVKAVAAAIVATTGILTSTEMK